MGRRHQEIATGLTYEERVKRAQGPLRRLFRYVKKRLNKEPPIHYANVKRDGVAAINPNLIKKNKKEV